MLRRVIDIAGSATVICQWAPRSSAQAFHTFVMIPGNPGVADFYNTFLETIHKICDGQIEIFCVGHAGHSTLPSGYEIGPPLNLAQQVQHKVEYISQLHKENPKRRFILAGHSVGAYMCLQILKTKPAYAVDKVFLLLPTLHHIGDTPRGRQLTPVIAPIPRTIISTIAGGLYLLPAFVKQWLVQLGSGQSPEDAAVTAECLIHPQVAYNAFSMGANEMEQLRELDTEVITDNVVKLSFFYGQNDGWAPIEHYHDMKKMFPSADVNLCEPEIPHAFVLGHSVDFGNTIGTITKTFSQQMTSLIKVSGLLDSVEKTLEQTKLQSSASSASSSTWTDVIAVGSIATVAAMVAVSQLS